MNKENIMNEYLTADQFDQLHDLVQLMCDAANTKFEELPEKRTRSLETYRGILDYAERKHMLTLNQMKTLDMGCKILKLPMPLWLTINYSAAEKWADLDKANLEVPGKTPPQPLAALAENTQALVNLVERLEQRVGELERAIAVPKSSGSSRVV